MKAIADAGEVNIAAIADPASGIAANVLVGRTLRAPIMAVFFHRARPHHLRDNCAQLLRDVAS